jgi:hypothetical protein
MKVGSKPEHQSQALPVFLVRAKDGSYPGQKRRSADHANRRS